MTSSTIREKIKSVFSSTELYIMNLKEVVGAVLGVIKPTAKEREFMVNPQKLLTNLKHSIEYEPEYEDSSIYKEMDLTTGGMAAKVALHLPCFTHQPNDQGVRKPSFFHWIIAIIFCPVLTCAHFICPSTCCSRVNNSLTQCHLYSIPWGCNCCLCLNTQPKTCSCSNFYLCQLFRKAYLSSITFYGAIIAFLILIVYSTSNNFIYDILHTFEDMSDEFAVVIFVCLFTVASFPLVWGYVVLNLAAGYKFGVLWGVFIVFGSVTVGLTVAHKTSKYFCLNCIMGMLRRRSNFDQIESILKVLDTPAGLKIIALTRLTPIPFGLQNGLFSASNIQTRHYVAASNIGLLPTQILNCYIGSTFHSASDILNSGGSTGSYLVFSCQILLGFALMAFVIRHARRELNNALDRTTDDGAQKKTLADEDMEIEMDDVKVLQPKSSTANA